MAMDHQYIDANAVAQRYLVNRLRIEEREDFERHLVDCQECTDRILLAGMFHARSGNGVRAIHEATQPVTQDADPSPSPREFNGQGELGESPQSKSARELKTPEGSPLPALFVRVKPLQILWILLISAFLLVAIPALVWEIFANYSAR
jgi:hypothetical protein